VTNDASSVVLGFKVRIRETNKDLFHLVLAEKVGQVSHAVGSIRKCVIREEHSSFEVDTVMHSTISIEVIKAIRNETKSSQNSKCYSNQTNLKQELFWYCPG